MTDELISKTDVVKIVKSVLSPASSLTNVARARRQMLNEINELESKPEPHWIPVTEMLPKESGLYQVTDMQGDVVRYVFNVNESSVEYWRRCVKAWMPLPEPYKSTVPPECEGDCGWCKPSVIEKCKGVTE